MPTAKVIESSLDLIKLIGNRMTELAELRGAFDRNSLERKQLDCKHDQLNDCQRALADTVFNLNTKEFEEHAKSLREGNKELEKTIKRTDKLAETLESVVKIVNAVEKITKAAIKIV